MNAKLHLTADFQRRGHEHIQGVIDHALGGILHRHHTVMGRTGFHLAEDRINRGQWHTDHRVPEVLERRRLSKGAYRAQEGNVHGLFQRQAGRHDLTEQPRHFFSGQRPGVLFLDPAQHLGFAFRPVKENIFTGIGRHFYMGHFLRTFRPGTDQLHDLLIEGVDLFP